MAVRTVRPVSDHEQGTCDIAKRITIHRDHTFEYAGGSYVITQGAERWKDLAFSIERRMSDLPGGLILVEDGFRTISDIREYVNDSATSGRPLESDKVFEAVLRRQAELRDAGTAGSGVDTLDT